MRWWFTRSVTLLAVAALAACASGSTGSGRTSRSGTNAPREAPMTLSLTSPLFADGEMMPTRSTCDGEDLSPPLAWSPVPGDTAELALTMEDPDAPRGTFVHWVLWGLGPTTHELDEGIVPKGAHQGRNSAGKTGYMGPCPPRGDRPHRYVFTLYAVSSPLTLADGATIEELRGAMQGKVLDEGRLVGRYAR